MHPVEQYLSEIGTIRATRAGTGETSYYPALAKLLDEIGKTLAPKVSCVIQLQNRAPACPMADSSPPISADTGPAPGTATSFPRKHPTAA